jgi:O-antigen ligase
VAGTGTRMTWLDIAAPCSCALVVFVGYFKGNPIFAEFPFDLTLFASLLLVVGIIGFAISQDMNVRISPWGLAFVVTFVPGWLFFDSDNPYNVQKLFGMLVTLLAAIGPLYLLTSERRLVIWVWTLMGVGVLFAFGTIDAPSLDRSIGGLALEGSNTIATGQAIGVACVVAFVFALMHQGWVRFVFLGAGLFFGTFIVLSGSRGPLLAASVAVVAVALARAHGRVGRLLILAACGLGGWYFVAEARNAGASRIASSIGGQINVTSTRTPLWHDAFRAISDSPLSLTGVGWGNFADVQQSGNYIPSGTRTYPHNVILEIWMEGGVVPFIATIIFVGIALWRLSRLSENPYGAGLFAMTLFAVFNALVSGDVNDNRLMWASAAIGWMASEYLANRAPSSVDPGSPWEYLRVEEHISPQNEME